MGFRQPPRLYRLEGSALTSPGCWSLFTYGRIPAPMMGIFPPRVRRDLGVGPRGNSRRTWLHEPRQLTIRHWGWGFHTLQGGIDPTASAFSSPGCWNCRDIDECLTGGWELIPSGCGGISALARGATLAPAGYMSLSPSAIDPRKSAGSSPGCWSCREMEGFLTRG